MNGAVMRFGWDGLAGGMPSGFACAALLLCVCAGPVRAGVMEEFMRKEIDVITVTDVTEAGQAYAPATPAKPVRYKMIYVGETSFGRTWAGESIPPKAAVLKWMIAAMKTQGYLLADEKHLPEQLLVFGWGMMSANENRPALGFLGGDRVNLMWEQGPFASFETANILRRGMLHVGLAAKIWEYAGSNLFLGVVRSFTLDSLDGAKTTQLWETRFACPAAGLALDQTMPYLIQAASLNFGRETKLPVNLSFPEPPGGHVDLGELQIISSSANGLPAKPDKPVDGR